MTSSIPDHEVEAFRAYQRTGSYEDAAAQLGVSTSIAKRRIMSLYKRLGAINGVHASWLLPLALEAQELLGQLQESG